MTALVDAENFSQWLSEATACRDIVFQALDLQAADDALATLPQATCAEEGCLVLGCSLGPKFAAMLASHFGAVFPLLPNRPYNCYRSSLYSVEELFSGYDPCQEGSYYKTLDWRTYESFILLNEENRPVRPTQYVDTHPDGVLARRLHDHFIEIETKQFLSRYRSEEGKGIVSIMGGHDMARTHPAFRQIAELSRELTRQGMLVASGGGPGLMEAANLGAYFSNHTDSDLDRALDILSSADFYHDTNWLRMAWQVRVELPPPASGPGQSIGVPTWFYGHEPPNVFATHIAKYFENSLREEGLLAIATHGVVFGEGNGGTVQEIFQDACQNYYSSYEFASPMILLGEGFWNPQPDEHGGYPAKSKPVWPLLRKIAKDGNFDSLIGLTSDIEVALQRILTFRAPWQI